MAKEDARSADRGIRSPEFCMTEAFNVSIPDAYNSWKPQTHGCTVSKTRCRYDQYSMLLNWV